MLRLICCLLGLTAALYAAKPLEIFFIDVEGGQSTLIVAPSGQSMLIDTGWRGFNGRDANRIAEAAKAAKVKQLDYVLITHYHRDHVGGAPALADQLKIGTFIDHGPNREDTRVVNEDFADYQKILPKAQHLVAKPGDSIPLKGVTVEVLTADGAHIQSPVAGAGQPNPFCAATKPREADTTENARSLGILLTFGSFRFIDLGDLTWNKELELMCPNNLAGSVDVYLTSHHGLFQSGSPALVHALHPRVAIMNNGARKGGSPDAWQIVKDSPGLEDLWQLHYSVEGAREHNVPDSYIANIDEACEGKYLKLTAESDGSFTVINSRNKFQRTYKAK
jgi:competence protein ComEC